MNLKLDSSFAGHQNSNRIRKSEKRLERVEREGKRRMSEKKNKVHIGRSNYLHDVDAVYCCRDVCVVVKQCSSRGDQESGVDQVEQLPDDRSEVHCFRPVTGKNRRLRLMSYGMA